MDIRTRRFLNGLFFVLGLVLLVGGIARRMYGAVVIGLCIAAVNFRMWRK